MPLKYFYIKWVLIGILIRLLVIPFTIHPDIKLISLGAYLISFVKNLDFYDYLPSLSSTDNIGIVFGGGAFTYPPAIFFFLAIFMFILKPLYGSMFSFWLTNNLLNSFQDAKIFRYLFLLKLPYLIFDLSLAFILVKFFNKIPDKKTVFKLWMINPVGIYASFALGQFDIIPTFFTVVALLLAMKNKPSWSALMIGLGAAFKIYPIFLLPILAVFWARKITTIIKIFILGLAPLILTILPFFDSINFRSTVLSSEQSQRIMAAGFDLGQNHALYLFFFILGLLCLYVYLNQKTIEDLWKYFLIILLIFLGFSYFHPQWFLWVTPFLIIHYVKTRNTSLTAIIIILYLIILAFFENSLLIGLLSPVNYLFSQLPSLAVLVHPIYNADKLRNIFFSFFSAAIIYFSYNLLREKDKTDE